MVGERAIAKHLNRQRRLYGESGYVRASLDKGAGVGGRTSSAFTARGDGVTEIDGRGSGGVGLRVA